MMIRWARFHKGGYEVSTKGDKRFSALVAILEDGRSIEAHYQCDVKGYAPGGTNWRLGKGKPPLDPSIDLYGEYRALWERWADNHYDLIQELIMKAAAHDFYLTDVFGTTEVTQARALAEICNEYCELQKRDQLNRFKMTPEGYKEAKEWLAKHGLEDRLEKELSKDGYTLIALANHFYSLIERIPF